jgi:cytochrome b
MNKTVAVWDIPTRLFHWLLVGLFAVMWYSGEQGGDLLRLHIWCGEAVLALLLFRLLWGCVGSQTARFAQFVRGPLVLRRYLAGKLSEAESPGHNPLGGLMVVALLLVLLFQVLTGLFSSDVDSYLFDGPLAHRIAASLSEQITAVHKLSFNLILLLVGLHVLAVLAHKVFKKQNLVRAMLSGRKQIDGEVAPLRFAPLSLAVASLVLSIGLVLALVLGVA